MNPKRQPKIRKSWGDFRPTERVHRQGKRPGYNRRQVQKEWQKEFDI